MQVLGADAVVMKRPQYFKLIVLRDLIDLMKSRFQFVADGVSIIEYRPADPAAFIHRI